MKKLTIIGVLAIFAYAAAAGISIADWPAGLWIIGVVSALMCGISHPASSHLICSTSLVLTVLVQTGRIEWLSEFIPAFGIVIGLVGTTKSVADSRKQNPIPQWESNGYDDRVNAGMVFVGDGDD